MLPLKRILLIALLTTTTVAGAPSAHATGPAASGDGCLNSTDYSALKDGTSAREVYALAGGSPVQQRIDGRTVVSAYPRCYSVGIVMVRLQLRSGVWRVDDKRSLRAVSAQPAAPNPTPSPSPSPSPTPTLIPNASPTTPAARSVAGCFEESGYGQILDGTTTLERAEEIADGGPIKAWEPTDKVADVRLFFGCDDPGLVVLRTEVINGSRVVTGKRSLF